MNARAQVTRRNLLQGAALTLGLASSRVAIAGVEADGALRALTKGIPPQRGRVSLNIPAIAENGLSVYTTVVADSPMTDVDYVKAIHLISEKNPIARIATFYFTPAMAQAKVSTNIRLSASQKVTALAIMSDGTAWFDDKNIVVTIAACIDGG